MSICGRPWAASVLLICRLLSTLILAASWHVFGQTGRILLKVRILLANRQQEARVKNTGKFTCRTKQILYMQTAVLRENKKHTHTYNSLVLYLSFLLTKFACLPQLVLGSVSNFSFDVLSFPADMAEPIQQLSSDNQGRSQREHIPFTLLMRKEKVSLHFS